MPATHDKIIANAAKAALGPLGFKRKGRSRTWLADHSWWLTVVEFQPSAWSKGSYLNVAAHWLWSNKGHISFDFGGRIAGHVQYVTDSQFTAAAYQLAENAANEAERLAQRFGTLSEAAEILLEDAQSENGQPSMYPGWRVYHAGVAAALVGRTEEARKMFIGIVQSTASPGSVLHRAAERMVQLLNDPRTLREEAETSVEQQRAALRLAPLTAPPF